MTIKNKLRIGISFLFLLALVCCGLSIYFVNRLSGDEKNILKDNYLSVRYTKNICTAIDAEPGPLNSAQIKVIEQNLSGEERDITERGEGALTVMLRLKFEALKKQTTISAETDTLRVGVRTLAYGIMQLNMSAIERKYTAAIDTGNHATVLMAFVGSFLFLVAFSFVINFPGYIANPIKELTESIKEVANRNFQKQLDFK